jgi:hypothetical protein
MRVYENGTLIMFGPVRLTALHEELHNLYSSPEIVMMIILWMRWAGHVGHKTGTHFLGQKT